MIEPVACGRAVEISGTVQEKTPGNHAQGQERQHQDDDGRTGPVYAGLARLYFGFCETPQVDFRQYPLTCETQPVHTLCQKRDITQNSWKTLHFGAFPHAMRRQPELGLPTAVGSVA